MADSNSAPIEIPDRALRAKIRELEKKLGVKHVEEPLPTATPELWPGGPSVDTGDIQLARGKRRRGPPTRSA